MARACRWFTTVMAMRSIARAKPHDARRPLGPVRLFGYTSPHLLRGEPALTDSTPKPGDSSSRPPLGHASSTGRYVLLVLGDEQGKYATFPLPDNGSVVIGRSHKCDIRIDDPSLSRQHAILHIGPKIWIEDLNSANGTRVRDARLVYQNPTDSIETAEFMDRHVTARGRVEVSPGDVIELGSTVVVVQHAVSGARPRRLWSHGYFEGRLEEECARAERTKSSFALVRVHVDEASAGGVEEALAVATRSVDVVASYGPGEFEMLVVDVDTATATEVHNRLLQELKNRGVVARIGVAMWPQDGRNPEALVAKACARVVGADGTEQGGGPLIVLDPAMQRLYRLAERVADSTICVLLLGETGVGKEVLAETIHRRSPRAGKPFLRLNCAALSESLLESELFGHERGAFTGALQAKPGLLEAAHGGTVFLDEIGELPLSTQAKLLRVFEGHEVIRVGAVKPRSIDVRFIAATNRDLEQAAQQGLFREDLYFRISGVSLVIPPLRERTAEIEPLARAFMRQAARDRSRRLPSIAPDALRWLHEYSWPGNVRELRNVIERAMLLCGDGPITLDHLPTEKMGATLPSRPFRMAPPPPPPPRVPRPQAGAALPAGGAVAPTLPPQRAPGPPGDDTTAELRRRIEEAERERILQALDACAGNQTRAAKLLGISRRTLVSRLDQYNIARPRKNIGEE
jgi:two-component system response regulator AtoC